MFVVIERSTASGRSLETFGGILLSAGRIYAPMVVLDGADIVRVVEADGSRRQVTSIVGWNRRQDWAVLAGDGGAASVPVAPGDSIKVGNRCFSMEGGASGGRVLLEGGLTGQIDTAATGRRYLVSFLNGSGTPGSPVLNEFGELVGMTGGSSVPGASRLLDLLKFRAELKGAPDCPDRPHRGLPRNPRHVHGIAELQARGELVLPIVGDEHVVSGGFAKTIVKGPVVAPADQREAFSSIDKSLVTWVNWNPQQRVRGVAQLGVQMRTIGSSSKVSHPRWTSGKAISGFHPGSFLCPRHRVSIASMR